MTKPFTPPATTSASAVAIRHVSFSDIGIAPENLRAKHEADDGIGRLADTIRACGVIIPLLVRAGDPKEAKPTMALDGRRRLLALQILLDAGDIAPDYQVPVIVSEGREANAAAAYLANTERVPVHIADVITAIAVLRRRKFPIPGIAAALAYDELEVRRLLALSELDGAVIGALREGAITLKIARMMTRIPDKAKQRELIGDNSVYRLHENRLRGIILDEKTVASDSRLRIVSLEAYEAAGGKIERDLFDEIEATLSDSALLGELWHAWFAPLRERLAPRDIALITLDERPWDRPEGLMILRAGEPDDDQREAYETHARAAAEAIGRFQADPQDPEAGRYFGDWAEAVIAATAAANTGASVTLARIYRSASGALVLEALGPEPVAETRAGEEEPLEPEGEDHTLLGAPRPFAADYRGAAITVPVVEVDVEGESHAFHAVTTDIATRGLIRELADSPQVALTLLIAQLFKTVVLKGFDIDNTSLLQIKGAEYTRPRVERIAALDGEVADRLKARHAAYVASGLRPIPWVETLAYGERMAFLAELTALSLNGREERTDAIRQAARAEAREVAELLDADISRHWAADDDYLACHSKKQLIALLAEMAIEDPRTAAFKKAELVTFVAEACAERRYAPAALKWTSEPETIPVDETAVPVETAASEGEADGEVQPGAEPEEVLPAE
jgi:ParB family chromosome partitioning protein